MIKSCSKIFTSGAIILLMIMVSCTENEEPDPGPLGPTHVIWQAKSRAILDRMDKNGLAMLRMSVENSDPGKFAISPLSAHTLTGMLANGADNTSLAEMLSFFNTDSTEEINSVLSTINAISRGTDNNATVDIRNAIWFDNDTEPQQDFISAISSDFEAASFTIDLNSPNGQLHINNWISDATHSRIPEFLTQVPEGWHFFAANTLYFNAPWTDRFHDCSPQVQTFRNIDNTRTATPFMENTECYAYAEKEGEYQAVQIPFGNASFIFTAWLPAENKTVEDILSILENGEDAEFTSEGNHPKIMLRLPQFDINTTVSLTPILSRLGLETLWSSESADFSRMTHTPAFLTDMRQSVSISIDKDGSTVAAATGTGIDGALPPDLILTYDRPFIFSISAPHIGATLVNGVITKL